mgnify:CR=1 FL=1
MKTQRSPAEIAAEIAASLMWGPKPRKEIAETVGLKTSSSATLNKHLDQFRASGCVYIHGHTELGREIFGWQPKPFERPDAVKAAKPVKVKGQRINAVRVMVGGVQMSIKEASEKLGLKRKVIEYRRQKGLPLVSGDLRKCQPSQA